MEIPVLSERQVSTMDSYSVIVVLVAGMEGHVTDSVDTQKRGLTESGLRPGPLLQDLRQLSGPQ
jgi:hypothetical protein